MAIPRNRVRFAKPLPHAFWMNLQSAHDLSAAEIENADALDEIEAFDKAS